MTFSSLTGAPVYTSAEIRELEQRAFALTPRPPLMERAGLAAARIARDIAGDAGRAILVIAGPGNNGGDAFIAARHLKSWWFKVDVVFADDPAKLSEDARSAYAAWRDSGGTVLDAIPRERRWGLIIDGLFGIGLKRELKDSHAALVGEINRMATPVLALDVPSGLDADSGNVLGCAVRADHTATFIALKPGLLTNHGPDYCGRMHVCALDLDAVDLCKPSGATIGADIVARALPPRRSNSHKGDYGSVGIIGGAAGMVGAALLAGRAALKLGAGRVYVGLLARDAPTWDPVQPELMLRPAHEVLALEHLNCLAIGPGLGLSPDAHSTLATALRIRVPLVIDADGLNLIAADSGLQQLVIDRETPTLLTPHPAEAARLLGITTAEVQTNRVEAARNLAARYRCGVTLKGAGSICALSDGRWFINTSGNPGMASAGMGDVLTGIIAALLAQGAAPANALLAATHLHGAAADREVVQGRGPAGLTATDVIAGARTLFNQR